MEIKVEPGIYRHFKSSEILYEVLGEATHSETGEKLVVYRHIEQGVASLDFWVRPVLMFNSKVPEGRENPNHQTYRFEKIEKYN